jgi:hypothetical protein
MAAMAVIARSLDMNNPLLNDNAPDRPATHPHALSRRRLLRAGAVATPVVLTLSSTPVAATNATCTVASSFVSAATFQSRNAGASAQCTSWGCESWKTECSNSSSPYNSALDTTVGNAFGATGCSYDNRTLRSILNDSAGIVRAGELGVLQHLTALGLGLTFGKVVSQGNVSTSYVQGVWRNFRQNGGVYILSGSGINWSSSDLVTWARMLMYTNP